MSSYSPERDDSAIPPTPVEVLTPLEYAQRYARPVEYRQPRRRVRLPVVLFVVTCLSTFWAGACGDDLQWVFLSGVQGLVLAGQLIAAGWQNGLVYMAAVMGILLAHEMGHFLQAVRYRVPASLPYFIPMPLSPIGTMGAVIGMQGSHADRRQLFDIGLSGPLAGLVLAVPALALGIRLADVTYTPPILEDPLLVRGLIHWLRPDLAAGEYLKFHPLYMAGWVGLFITGLNMLPVSQLDGGHVAYALFGRRAHLLARGVLLAAGLFILASGNFGWMLMLLLVMYIGPDHPPTANDRVPLGTWRVALGLASLTLPIYCFTPILIRS